MRKKVAGRKGVDVDTCAAAFGLLEKETVCLPTLGMYDLVYVDEVSQMDSENFEKVLKLWAAVDKKPALVFSGDKHQMCGYGDKRPWHSKMWSRLCKEKFLSRVYR